MLKSYIEITEESCSQSNCPIKLYLQKKEKGIDCPYFLFKHLGILYKYGISKFKDSSILKIDYSLFLTAKMYDSKKALMLINSINEDLMSFQSMYPIYICKSIINEFHPKTNSIYFEYQNTTKELEKLIAKVTMLYYDFWSTLDLEESKEDKNMQRLYKTGNEIIYLNAKIEKLFNRIIKTNNNNIVIYKLYMEYLSNILNNEDKIKQCQNVKDLIFTESLESKEKIYINYNIDILKQTDDAKFILISANEKDRGTILDCSISARIFFWIS